MRTTNWLAAIAAAIALSGCGDMSLDKRSRGQSEEDGLSLASSIQINSFTLVNADTNKPIPGYETLANGAIIALSTLPTPRVNIVANAASKSVISVKFGYDGKTSFRIENLPPYYLFGDNQGDAGTGGLSIGQHTLKATPYPAKYAKGTAGNSLSIQFTVEQDVPGGVDPNPSVIKPIPLASPRKIYVMQGIDQTNVNDATLARAEGLVIRTKWSTVEPQPGQFNLTYVKAQIARAVRLNKMIQLEVLSGDDSPTWLAAQGAAIYKFSGGQIPLPWDEVFQQRYAKMIAHITANLDFSKITHFHSIGADNAEWHYNQFDAGGFYKVAGFTDDKMAGAHVRAVGTLVNAMPKAVIVVNIGDHNRTWTGKALDALKAKYKGHVGFQMDSLKASLSTTYAGFTRIRDAAAQGHHAGFEFVGPSVTNSGQPIDRFGGSFSDALDIADMTEAQWMIYYQADL